MPLENYEVLEVVSRACQKAADAMKEDSAGGKTFTKKETIDLVISSLTDLASEYMDDEPDQGEGDRDDNRDDADAEGCNNPPPVTT